MSEVIDKVEDYFIIKSGKTEKEKSIYTQEGLFVCKLKYDDKSKKVKMRFHDIGIPYDHEDWYISFDEEPGVRWVALEPILETLTKARSLFGITEKIGLQDNPKLYYEQILNLKGGREVEDFYKDRKPEEMVTHIKKMEKNIEDDELLGTIFYNPEFDSPKDFFICMPSHKPPFVSVIEFIEKARAAKEICIKVFVRNESLGAIFPKLFEHM